MRKIILSCLLAISLSYGHSSSAWASVRNIAEVGTAEQHDARERLRQFQRMERQLARAHSKAQAIAAREDRELKRAMARAEEEGRLTHVPAMSAVVAGKY